MSLLASPCPWSSVELKDAWDGWADPWGVSSLEDSSCSNLRGERTQDVITSAVRRLDFCPGSASDWLETLGKSLNPSTLGKWRCWARLGISKPSGHSSVLQR